MTTENATITVTNRLPTDTAFGIRKDTLAQVFIPAHIARGANLSIQHTYDVVVAHNDGPNSTQTPWRVIQMQAAQKSPATGEDKILALLREGGIYTTAEVADEIGLDATNAALWLKSLFTHKKIARAEIHERPDQIRASAHLWALNLEEFIGEQE